MTTMQLECFLAVAETLNFAKAAGQLNVTQPAVTQQIHSLEEELNVQLFRRTTRMVQMTPEAYAFLDDARHILHLIHFTKRRFREQGSEGRLPFNIGSHAHNDLDLLTDVLRSMAEIYPEMLPVFQVVPFQHLYKLLAEEMVDVVVAFQTKDEKESYGKYKELIKVPLAGVVPVEHPLSEYGCLTAEDLERQRLVFIAPNKCPGGLRAFQHDLIKDRAPADMMFCEDQPYCWQNPDLVLPCFRNFRGKTMQSLSIFRYRGLNRSLSVRIIKVRPADPCSESFCGCAGNI